MESNAFNEKEYLALYPDVAHAVQAGAFTSGWEHYQRFGKSEGREPSGYTARERAVFHLIDKMGIGLEIGPSINPIAPKRKGYNVHIVDHASADELRAKYRQQHVNLDNIEEVDFVSKGEPLTDLIGKTEYYDWIIASHVVELIPDLISFFQSCEKLLKPAGVLSLVVPDKRFCFDYFMPLTSTGVLLDAYAEKRVRPSPGQVFDHFANASIRDGAIAWADDQKGANALLHTFSEAKAQWQRAGDPGEGYIDVHCWRFTPASFRLIISDLNSLGLTDLQILAEFDTVGCEFYVSLGRKNSIPSVPDRLSLLRQINLKG